MPPLRLSWYWDWWSRSRRAAAAVASRCCIVRVRARAMPTTDAKRHRRRPGPNGSSGKGGADMMARGGSVVDAAIAAQLVPGLVEPQSSGLGGGGFALLHRAGEDAVHAYDGRETAPAAARPDRFIRNGEVLDFAAAVDSGL